MLICSSRVLFGYHARIFNNHGIDPVVPRRCLLLSSESTLKLRNEVTTSVEELRAFEDRTALYFPIYFSSISVDKIQYDHCYACSSSTDMYKQC